MMMFRMFLTAATVLVLIIAGCATTASKPASTREVLHVQVEQGDTLNKIAEQFDVDWRQIVIQNKETLTGGLRVGQVLSVIPGPRAQGGDKLAQNEDTSNLHADHNDYEEDDLELAPRRKGLLFGSEADKKSIDFIYPTEGRISSKFGKRGRKFHKGIDIVVNVGTPIVALADGDVIFSGKRRGYGGTVVIDHGTHMSLYAHCSKMIAKVGDSVKQGDYIAKSGRTGNARGAHLHFEIRDANNRPLDPLPLLRRKSVASLNFEIQPLANLASYVLATSDVHGFLHAN